MPYYSYKCQTCGSTKQELRNIDDREAPTKCGACGKEASFAPFGAAPTVKFDVNYHKAGSSDGKVWDHLLGESALKGNIQMAEQFKKKNKIVADGGAAVFRQDKGAYRPATGLDIPQIVTNRIGATHPGVKKDIAEGRVKNDLVPKK